MSDCIKRDNRVFHSLRGRYVPLIAITFALVIGNASGGDETPWGAPLSELRQQAEAEAEALRQFANEFARTYGGAKAEVRKVILCDSTREVALQLYCGGYFPFLPGEELPELIRRGSKRIVAGAHVGGRMIFIATPCEWMFFHEAGHVVLQTSSENKASVFADHCLHAWKERKKTLNVAPRWLWDTEVQASERRMQSCVSQ